MPMNWPIIPFSLRTRAFNLEATDMICILGATARFTKFTSLDSGVIIVEEEVVATSFLNASSNNIWCSFGLRSGGGSILSQLNHKALRMLKSKLLYTPADCCLHAQWVAFRPDPKGPCSLHARSTCKGNKSRPRLSHGGETSTLTRRLSRSRAKTKLVFE